MAVGTPSTDQGDADCALWYALYKLETRFWYEVNVKSGLLAHEFYVSDGVFAVGERRHAGRTKIQEFYAWRNQRGARTARHLISNFQVNAGRNERCATAFGVISVYGNDGEPVLPSQPATMIADFVSEALLCDDNIWRFQSHVLQPLFRGEGKLT